MRVQLLTSALVLASLVACRRQPAASGDVAALLRSTDAVRVYDAGVAAYRAKDYAVARSLWQRASELGDREATANVGFLVYHGFGGPADSAAALELWRRAMMAGDAEAHRHVADAALDGDVRFGTARDAYAHAIAAELLASRPGELSGGVVARDARETQTRARTQLSPEQIAESAARGHRMAADTVAR